MLKTKIKFKAQSLNHIVVISLCYILFICTIVFNMCALLSYINDRRKDSINTHLLPQH